MKVLCSYCGKLVRTLDEESIGVSHGVCDGCLPLLAADLGIPLSDFVEQLGIPVLVVDENLRVTAANAAARRLAPGLQGDFRGLLCGEVIGCGHSFEPGGCGGTVHCLSCVIRKAVEETFCTGTPCRDVPAFPDIQLFREDRDVQFLVSTRKVGPFVELKIRRIR